MFSERGAIRFDESDPAVVFFNRCQSCGRLWKKIRWRDGSIHAHSDGIWCGAFVSFEACTGLGLAVRGILRASTIRSQRSNANAFFVIAEAETQNGSGAAKSQGLK